MSLVVDQDDKVAKKVVHNQQFDLFCLQDQMIC